MNEDRRLACWRTNLRLVGLCLTISFGSASAESLTPDEQRMADWIDTHASDAVALLEETVNIPSGSLNQEGVREVGRVMRRELDAIGLDTEWINMPAEMDRAGHLFGRKNGSGTKFLLIGHLDTVFEIENGVRPFESDGEIARGHGVYDMKAGNVIMVYALKALQQIGALDDIPVTVAYTGDEEKSGRPIAISRKELIEAGKWADVALGFEEAMYFDDTDWATVARRSSSRWVLTVEGKQSHSSNIFNDETGAGAIFEAARILNAFYDEVRGEEHLTFNAGRILGGTEVDTVGGQNLGTPWLSFFIGEKGEQMNDDELFKNSLNIAVELAKTDKFEEYKSGYSAFKKWIEELKKQSEAIKSFVFKEYEINLTIFNSLLDSRKAAVGYLTSMNDKMKRGGLIINNYKKEVELLTETQKNVLPSFNAEAHSWTTDIINKQVEILTEVLSIEKKTIHLIEKELKC